MIILQWIVIAIVQQGAANVNLSSVDSLRGVVSSVGDGHWSNSVLPQ